MPSTIQSFLISILLTSHISTASSTPTETCTPTRTRTISPISSTISSQPTTHFADLLSLANATSPTQTLLQKRCANPCGWAGQICCGTGQQCYTNALTQAECTIYAGATSAATGYWSYYTSFATMTNTVTNGIVYSTWVNIAASPTLYVPMPASPTETESAATCKPEEGQIACGPICCASDQYCVVSGQCGISGFAASSSPLSAPLRVTSSTLLTVTTSISPTTTEAFQSAIATSNVTLTEAMASGGSGLNGGAIAGIVIGVLAAIVLLTLLLLFCCARAVWDGIFGGSKRRDDRRPTRVTEETYYGRHDSRNDGRTWYGAQNRPSRPPPRKKEGGLGWAGVAAGLGGLAGGMWLKRREDRKKQKRYEEKSSTRSGESYYSGESSYLTGSVEEERREVRDGRGRVVEEERYESRRTRR